MSDIEQIAAQLGRIEERLGAGALQMQDMAHALHELGNNVRQQNGRVGTLEASELKRALSEAENRGAAKARRQLWAGLVGVGGAVFGAIGGLVAKLT